MYSNMNTNTFKISLYLKEGKNNLTKVDTERYTIMIITPCGQLTFAKMASIMIIIIFFFVNLFDMT